jgi:type I pantothenate kinase
VGGRLYRAFTRQQWAALRAHTPLTLSTTELAQLRGVYEVVSLEEVVDVFLPLSRLLNLHISARYQFRGIESQFLDRPSTPQPFIIGLAGSVAVGKSTFARVLRALLARWPEHPNVGLVTTDGFLHPNRILKARRLMHRKGFPESYDLRRMIDFLDDIKAGAPSAAVPVYSHLAYDILPDQWQYVHGVDILIFEGLNVLQPPGFRVTHGRAPTVVASDFFDFSIYLDASEEDLESWYIERFISLQRSAFLKPESYFHRYKDLSPAEARNTAQRIWRDINLPNLEENIRPTRDRAFVVLRKRPDHSIGEVLLRRY